MHRGEFKQGFPGDDRRLRAGLLARGGRNRAQSRLAAFQGRTHFFENTALYLRPREVYYSLTPVAHEFLPLFVEREALHTRLEKRRSAGWRRASVEEAESDAEWRRWAEVVRLLDSADIRHSDFVVARGEFRRAAAPAAEPYPAWEVRWTLLTDHAHEHGRLRPFRPAV